MAMAMAMAASRAARVFYEPKPMNLIAESGFRQAAAGGVAEPKPRHIALFGGG